MINQGMHVDRFKETIVRGISKRPYEFEQHIRTHGISCAENLYNIESGVSGLPHFMIWSDTKLIENDYPMGNKRIMDLVSPYMANMTDEELGFFKPTLVQLVGLYRVVGVEGHDGVLAIRVVVAGQAKQLLVSVMNMMDMNPTGCPSHWANRSTLN